jgi:hypothetical protein
MCFNNVHWMGMNQIIGRCARMLKDWCWIQKPQDAVVLERWAEGFEKIGARPPPPSRLAWVEQQDHSVSISGASVRLSDAINGQSSVMSVTGAIAVMDVLCEPL